VLFLNEPILYREEMQILNKKVFNPELSKDYLNVKNYVSVSNFEFTATAKKDTVPLFISQNTDSISAYGKKEYSFGGKPFEILFINSSANYAQTLASLYTNFYSEPLAQISFQSDISSIRRDLKTVFSIVDSDSALNDSDISAIFEVYGFNFDTRRFQVTIAGQWAGYLIAPSADPMKRWLFWDNGNFTEEISTEIKYYFW